MIVGYRAPLRDSSNPHHRPAFVVVEMLTPYVRTKARIKFIRKPCPIYEMDGIGNGGLGSCVEEVRKIR